MLMNFNLLADNSVNIIPYPQSVKLQPGNFKFDKNTVLSVSTKDVDVIKIAEQFQMQLNLVSGINLKLSEANSQSKIEFIKTDSAYTNNEAYRLSVSPRLIRIEAATSNGFFYALQTLYQLLPPDIYGKTRSKIKKWEIPCVNIEDAPRFSYRGLHLDVCRHFFPVEFIKKYIDAMAIHKLNRFHWHLTDDQGWRIEIKKYPLLTEIGSQRTETLIGHYYENMPQQFDNKTYGGYYTQDEAREIVKYAASKFITVIPEIEMPGHAMAAIAAYPYLSCTQQPLKVATKWGVFDDVFCPRDSTFTFLENVLSEVMAIFPSEYIHIGGDECPKTRWKSCPDCQAKIKELELKDEHELQSYFVQRIEKFVNSKGRKIIGWDEILEGGLAPNATVMSWRGIDGGIAAAKSGHNVIMTPMSHCYFDFYQAEPATEPTAIGGYVSLNKVYDFEPVPPVLTAEEAKYIVGAQANVWTEYITSTSHVEYMAYPRASALSEVLWTMPENKNWTRFSGNMLKAFERYKALDTNASKAFFDVSAKVSSTGSKIVEVTLRSDNPEAEIRYTTDNSTPDKRSKLYTSAVKLTKTTQFKSKAFLKNKPTGKEFSEIIPVSKATDCSYVTNAKIQGKTAEDKSLTNGKYGKIKTTSDWIVLSGEGDREILFNFEKSANISKIITGMLFFPSQRGLLAPEISVFTSTDGINYELQTTKTISQPTENIAKIYRPKFDFPLTSAQFVKIIFKNAGVANGVKDQSANSVLFLDEIEIY